MKMTLKKLLSLALAILLCIMPFTTAFADEDMDLLWDTITDEFDDTDDIPDPVVVVISAMDLSLKVGDATSVSAYVGGADYGASYVWKSTKPGVVSVSGSGKTATVTALAAGHAELRLTVTASDGRSDSDYISVDVQDAHKPVSVSGGGSLTMKEGESKKLSAGISGGSGSYVYEWISDSTGVINVADSMRNNAEIYAGRAGSGSVMLTVYDAEDQSNYATARWSVTVERAAEYTAPVAQLSRGTVDLGPGATGSLSISASGGSGSYDYYWDTDNSSIVTVEGKGSTVTIRATASLSTGTNRAQVRACAYDKVSGLVSDVVTCVVTVSGGSAHYDTAKNASVGKELAMDPITREINSAFKMNFKYDLNYSASVVFTNPSTYVGSLRLQDGTAVRAGTSYAFASFQDMIFLPTTGGSFTTTYRITDSGNVIEGTISLTVTGGSPVKSAYLSSASLTMSTYSSTVLYLTVTPSGAPYDVVWESANSALVSVTKNGGNAILRTNGFAGTTTVSAKIYDVNGFFTTCSCTVAVRSESHSSTPSGNYVNYNTSMTVVIGSDYYGTRLADSMSKKFKDTFGYSLSESDKFTLTSLGSSRYGTIYDKNGSVAVANRTYTFRDWIDMYFIPSAAGAYTFGYQVQQGTRTMRGTVTINVQASSITVSIDPTALRMSPYSSQYINLKVEPATASYRIRWESSNSSVASVKGSNATALVSTGTNGTATITAYVTDSRGVELVRTCSVLVNSSGTVFNPSMPITLGSPYVGTNIYSSLKSQFAAVYGITIPDSSVMRFPSTGNTEVGVIRLADGSMLRPNVDYTLAQYGAMYFQPVSQGTFSVPYTLTYAGKSLTGTITGFVSAANISTTVNLSANGEYSFGAASSNGMAASTLLADSIRNIVGTNWSHIRFSAASSSIGTLYLNASRTPITNTTNVSAYALSQLYFVPGTMSGTFSTPYTIYNASDKVLATGTLNIVRPGTSFTDVPAGVYYAPAVTWAVGKGVTSGTGGTLFSPNATVTRGQAVTFLWRAAGQPKAVSSVNPFRDVSAGAYYYDAILWAVQQGITNGTTDTTFSPNNPLNRQQLLAFLCRANGCYAGGSDWANLAVSWANDRGLLAGVPGAFTATSACPRSDVVYYLWKNYNA